MTKYFTILLFGSLLLAQGIQHTEIDAQIQKIKNADANERVKLMNAFKLKVAQMNQKERLNALKSIQKSMSTDTQSKTIDTGHNKQTLQIQTNNIVTYQNMNQQRVQGQVSRKEIESGMNGNFHPKVSH